MISVVIPLYNKEKQIVQTLSSVFAQTFQEFEIIIVNDGSTDNSVSEVQKITDTRIRVINQTNSGVSAARNKGISAASYELIAFLDADDEWKAEYLETQYALYKLYPNCGVYACNYRFQYEDGSSSPTIINHLPFKEEIGLLDNYFDIASNSHPPICSISIMVRKEAIQIIGGFPAGVKLGEDLITWAKLAYSYPTIAFCKKELAIYNFRSPKERVTPRGIPTITDYVGEELLKLLEQSKKRKDIALYTQRWFKIRMVTFTRLNMKSQADVEYEKIRALRLPLEKKIIVWHILNQLPYKITKFILYQMAKFQQV